ncbi:uncharacterized protein [Porites lutea]|uniref:uncharacterized protein n=1 Tax=Porites lutea TaxID=51062 RepID=UPI003CC613B2
MCKCSSGESEGACTEEIQPDSAQDGQNHHNLSEMIEIDPEKEMETFHVPKTSPDEEATDMVYDFKKNLLMIRMPKAQSCFMINSTGNAPKPAELAALRDENNNVGTPDGAPQRELIFKKVGSLDDRSELSDEMADLCKKLPIC